MTPVADEWYALFGALETVPSGVVVVLAWAFVHATLIFPAAGAYSYLERKLGADFQARVGPNRTGTLGMLQPVADGLKLLQKPGATQSWRERVWGTLRTMAIYSAASALPFGPLVVMADTEMNVFIPLWALSVAAFATLLMGMDRSLVQAWLGGARAAGLALSAIFPAALCVLTAALGGGGFRWADIVENQGAAPWAWGVVSTPFHPLAFIAFTASGLIFNAEGQRDLSGGVASGLSGNRLTVYRLSRFYVRLLWAAMTCALFLGGWALPKALSAGLEDAGAWGLLYSLHVGIVLIKAFLLMLLVAWATRTNPRVRIEQLTELSWKFVTPAALIGLMGAAAWRAFL